MFVCDKKKVILIIIFFGLCSYFILNFGNVETLSYFKFSKKTDRFSRLVRGEWNIFFIESSCVFNKTHNKEIPDGIKEGGVSLNARQACSVFSATFHNPLATVYLFHTCPLEKDYYNRSSPAVQKLLDVENFNLIDVGSEPDEWYKDTPLEGLQEKLKKSSYPIEHSADSLRILLLWKYGGIYLDLDTVVIKNLSPLGMSWGTSPRPGIICNGIISFQAGHDLALKILLEMNENYSPKSWISIGPSLVTKIVNKYCNNTNKNFKVTMELPKCNFKVFPKDNFFPVDYGNFKALFKKGSFEVVKKKLDGSYMSHLWNKVSKGELVEPGSLYHHLAYNNCRPIIDASGNKF